MDSHKSMLFNGRSRNVLELYSLLVGRWIVSIICLLRHRWHLPRRLTPTCFAYACVFSRISTSPTSTTHTIHNTQPWILDTSA